MGWRYTAAAVTIFIVAFISTMVAPADAAPEPEKLTAPPGFKVQLYARGLKGARFMAFDPSGNMFVTLTRSGRVAALKDEGGKIQKKIVLKGLNNPHGIAFYKGYLYIAETGRVVRYKYDPDKLKLSDEEVVVPDLPTRGGGHFTRTLAFGPDGMMYVSVGSSCNVCEEDDRRRAAVLRFNPDGTGYELFAEGLRNSVGIRFHPGSGELFATDNGRDWLGDETPPEEVNIIKKGGHYGWPYCYGNRTPDAKYKKEEFCRGTVLPVVEMQAHSAPLGLGFYTGDKFPPKYRGSLFIAFHGSWNRSKPTGYKVVRVLMKGGKPTGTYEDFITGWIGEEWGRWGRPVDVITGPDGALYVSDDFAGAVYRVTYEGE